MIRASRSHSRNGGRTESASRRRLVAFGVALAGATLARPALALPAAGSAGVDGSGLQVDVDRNGDTIVVTARADVAASAALTFATLADYDRLADFIPDLASSRTLSRNGASALVEQRGRATFGPFEQRFTVLLAIDEAPGAWVRARATGGDFKRFEAEYALTALDAATTRLAYRATLQPTAGVPPLVGVPIMRGMIRRQFVALLNEIGRRARA